MIYIAQFLDYLHAKLYQSLQSVNTTRKTLKSDLLLYFCISRVFMETHTMTLRNVNEQERERYIQKKC